MTLERRIAFAVFAIGVAVVVLALVSCDSPSEAACDDGDFALPVLGARLIDEDSIRFAYAGGEPCSFAVDRYKGRVYVELRSEADPDRRPPFRSGCAEGDLDFKLPSGIPIERIFGNPRLLDESEIEALLADGNDCVDVPERQPAFVID